MKSDSVFPPGYIFTLLSEPRFSKQFNKIKSFLNKKQNKVIYVNDMH